jgi:hypothetical protein
MSDCWLHHVLRLFTTEELKVVLKEFKNCEKCQRTIDDEIEKREAELSAA